MNETVRILHQIHLAHDAWGGMEKQFANLLAATVGDARFRHFLSEDLRDPAPGVQAVLPLLAAPPQDARRAYGVAIPNWRGLRQWRQRRCARQWQIDTVLSWNRFGDPRPVQLAHALGARAVYWERGAAWYARHRAPDADFLDGFDRYLANSEACAAMLRHWGVSAPIEICRPGIRTGAALAARMPRQREAGRPLILGFCARLQAFKGGVLAVHALHELHRQGVAAELRIAGDGPDRATMQRTAERLGLGARVRFLGRLDDTERFFDGLDLLLHPALREPYGNACAEALCHGVPVIAAAVDGLPEVVTDGVDGRCLLPAGTLDDYAALGGDTGDVYPRVYRPELGRVAAPGMVWPAALAEAVLAIAADATTYARYSAAALLHAQRFDYAAYVDRLAALLAPAAVPAPCHGEDQGRPAWLDRADKAAALVASAIADLHPGARLARVADIGCGDRQLLRALARRGIACRYQGYDRLPQAPDVVRLDIGASALPEGSDVAVLLGVSEYLPALDAVLARLVEQVAALVISHTVAEPARSEPPPRAPGWVEHLTRARFEQVLAVAGWKPLESVLTEDRKTVIWRCTRA